MREIEFRVWDKDLAKYLEGCEIDSLMAELSAKDDGRAVIIKQICPARYIFEQYTGLKDKNGKKIYEGDIVKVDSDVLRIPSEHKTEASLVYYDKRKTAFVYRTAYGGIPVGRHDTSIEVIGNVHENGEILGGEE